MSDTKNNAIAMLKEQKERLERLRERRTRLAGELSAKRQQLADACAEAKREFGTDDLGELRKLFASRETANDELVMEFELRLDEAEQKLADIERQVNV
jgi:ABC-type phosphate transport system auxiliary subunit